MSAEADGEDRLADPVLEEHQLAPRIRDLAFEAVCAAADEHAAEPAGPPCPACRGAVGQIVDVAELWRGKTFVAAHSFGRGVLELRQYTSSWHSDDLDSIPPMDAITVFERLREVEEFLLAHAPEEFAPSGDRRRGFLRVTKRRRPGAHGHQRIRLYAEPPPDLAEEWRIDDAAGASRPERLEMQGRPELTVGEFRGGIAAVVPERPVHPFEIVLYCRPLARGVFGDLDGNQRWGLSQAVRELTGALCLELAVRGYPEAYRWDLRLGEGRVAHLLLQAEDDVHTDDGPIEWVVRLREHLGLR